LHALALSSNVKKIKSLSRGITVPNAGVFRQIFMLAEEPGRWKAAPPHDFSAQRFPR
jgi:hypothetical protein